MSQPPIFVSYRRDSDVLRATLVRSVIEGAFNRGIDGPKVAVFQDIRQRPGVDWPIEIRARLHEARVVVAVIGPQWLTTQDSGRRRIDQDDDWVRQELQVALSSDKTVIPVLFETAMPEPEALPESIRDLANKLVVRVSDERVEDELQAAAIGARGAPRHYVLAPAGRLGRQPGAFLSRPTAARQARADVGYGYRRRAHGHDSRMDSRSIAAARGSFRDSP